MEACACLNGHDDALLDTYPAERLPVARRALAQSTNILEVVTNRNPLVRIAVQRLLLPLLSRPSINRRLTARVSQIDIGYRDGPLADDELSGGRVRPGDRAPDAHLVDAVTGQPLRLFDVLRGPQWTLLLVGASASHLDCDALPDEVDTCLITPVRSRSFSGRVVIQ